jgi:hypothetical protein
MTSLQILDTGTYAPEGIFQYAWFRIVDENLVERYQAVALRELAEIPILAREDYDLLGKQRAALRGLHNAGVNFVYTAAGIFNPEHIGIVQYYGATAESSSRQEAASRALDAMKAVEGTLAANYAQSQLKNPQARWIYWTLDFITRRSQSLVVLLGQPDPRNTRRGLGKDGELPNDSGEDLALEQNEILFRGLAKAREDFVFQVTARNLDRPSITRDLVWIANQASILASQREGSVSIGASLGIPLGAAIANQVSGATAHSDSTAHSQADGQSHGWGNSHTESASQTDSWASTVGGSETHTTSHGVTDGTSHTDSQAHTDSHSLTESHGTSETHGSSGGTVVSESSSANWSSGISDTQSSQQSMGSSQSHAQGESSSQSLGASLGSSVNAGIPGVVGASVNASVNASESQGVSATETTGSSETLGTGTAHGESSGIGGSVSQSSSVSSGWMNSVSESHGSAETQGQADTRSQADSQNHAESTSESHSVSRSWAYTEGHAESRGQADSQSQNWGESRVLSDAVGTSLGRSGGQGFSSGFSTGLIPSLSLHRTWRTENDAARRATEVLHQVESLFNKASAEGGFMTTAMLFTASKGGVALAEALTGPAFHGTDVPTPVMTVQPAPEDIAILRAHSLAFLPHHQVEPGDPFRGILGGRYSSFHASENLAAYTAPGLFEEGTANTVMAPIPTDVAFYPEMAGEVVLGHQISPATRQLTPTQVRLDREHLMHTLFAGDTGYGKSVAAMRLAYETTLHWKLRTVVLDFGAGWRQLLNESGLAGHVDIRQLWPNAVRPLRWNPLQIGSNIDPEIQWRAFADIFGSIAKLGIRRQKQELLESLRSIYVRTGVLVDDPEVRMDPDWGKVRTGQEESLILVRAGIPLGNLTYQQRQTLAILRSQRVGLLDLYEQVSRKLSTVSRRDTMQTGILEGILFRLNPLVQGAAAAQFSPGPGSIAIEDLGKPWGVTILEGGMFLDDFGKAFLLGWAGWHLYTDMVARRVHEVNNQEPALQIFFEEANKIFTRESSGSSEDDAGGVSASQRFSDMFRDARKYQAILHAITQSPHLIPDDIFSSCANMILAFLKHPRDKDLALSAIARSEKGFRDEEWRRFISDLPIGWSLGRLPFTTQRVLQRVFLFQPLILTAQEPTDADIERILGRVDLSEPLKGKESEPTA